VAPISATGIAMGPRPPVVEGEHDLMGDGWVELDGGQLIVAIRPKGLAGHFQPKEKRSYELAQVASWRTNGDLVEVSFGEVGPVATTGATAPSHLGKFRCTDADEAKNLTDAARAGGARMSQPPTHSGI
jgi:hypothetical protein